jgi:hypothetical protein
VLEEGSAKGPCHVGTSMHRAERIIRRGGPKPDGRPTRLLARKVTSTGIEVTGKIAAISEPGTLRDRVDAAWQSPATGATAMGSLSRPRKPIERKACHEWEWIEGVPKVLLFKEKEGRAECGR